VGVAAAGDQPTRFVEACGRRLEYVDVPARVPHRPALVFLHEGLGCVAMWGEFPARVADETGCRTVVYSRCGYGRSDPFDTPRTPRYLHDEALDALPAVRAALGLDRVVLVGHSDGGSIALIHAGAGRWPVAGLVVLAPHEFVEQAALRGIAAAGHAWRTTDLPGRLGRYHRDPERVFRAWHDTWLDPAFRGWTIEDYLPGIRCPIVAVQGEDDEYATMAQLDVIAARATGSPRVDKLRLANCGHLPHRDAPAAVVDAIATFVRPL
jgi:pimeloyl-ACP methyl ester carboxylesterase